MLIFNNKRYGSRPVLDRVLARAAEPIGCGGFFPKVLSSAPTTHLKVACGWIPALGTRGFHRPLSDPSTDLQVRCHGSERDGRDVPRAEMLSIALARPSGKHAKPIES